MAPFAVDQNQGGIRRQAAQVGRTHQSPGVADGLLVDVVGGNGLGQKGVHVPDAVISEGGTLNHVHRHRRILGRPSGDTGPQHDDWIEYRDFFIRISCFLGPRRWNRQDQHGEQKVFQRLTCVHDSVSYDYV